MTDTTTTMDLPEEYDDGWHSSIKTLWFERAALRLVFNNELDTVFQKQYVEIVERIKHLEQVGIHIISKMEDDNPAAEDNPDNDAIDVIKEYGTWT